MSEVDEFLSEMVPRQVAAERALCGGEAQARARTWSSGDSVTLFGAAARLRRGWAQVNEVSHLLAARMSRVDDYDLEVLAAGASGDLAYTVAFEHKTVVIDGEPVTYTLRVTHIYRREDGQWRIVHRHGDHPPG